MGQFAQGCFMEIILTYIWECGQNYWYCTTYHLLSWLLPIVVGQELAVSHDKCFFAITAHAISPQERCHLILPEENLPLIEQISGQYPIYHFGVSWSSGWWPCSSRNSWIKQCLDTFKSGFLPGYDTETALVTLVGWSTWINQSIYLSVGLYTAF